MITPENALKATRIVASVLEREVFPLVQGHQPRDDREECLWGYFQRLLPTIRGLAFLVQPSFFQLTLAANRNLLEILVDVTHLAHNHPSNVVDLILAWEDSAKLKAAEAAMAYLVRTNSTDSELYKVYSDFVERRGAEVRANRQRFWPPAGRHPDRWTGQNLLTDCRRADQLEPMGLEEFYETEYRRMNWNIHGSAFAGLRGLDISGIDSIYTLSQMRSAKFAQKATATVLQGLGLLSRVEGDLMKLARDFGTILVEAD